MNRFYEEVLVSADPDKGIAFSTLLIILAHYKVINDNQSLRLHEFLKRRARLQRVEEAVRRNTVIGFFDMLFWHRKFLRHKARQEASIMRAPPNLNIPAIFVDDEDDDNGGPSGSPSYDGSNEAEFSFEKSPSPAIMTPGSELDVSDMMGSAYNNYPTTPERQPRPLDTRIPALRRGGSADSIQQTPTASPIRTRRGIAGHNDSISTVGGGPSHLSSHSQHASVDEGARSRANSSVSAVSAQDVLEVLDNSAWGESIRKSFSTRRPDGGSSSHD